MLVTFEGIDCSGKSSQIKLLSDNLKKLNIDFIVTREPGGTEVGEDIRTILKTKSLDPKSELLLLYASRLEHIKSFPRDKLIICDRFDDSTVAYQHYGRGIPISFINSVKSNVIGDFKPDITFLLDIDMKERNRRISTRDLDPIEASDSSFHEKVIDGYREIAKINSDRFVVIDGNQDIQTISDNILNVVLEKIKK